ncbi:hypothetical protein LTR84_006900 [Exophiala bonariae]|uniref:Carboxypeptidase n=1 Tax=Exophiala bonariae TaxID=1690606 RepID=A0AAV9N0J4_9EURO|nr:hypothetical protein LTR84_006900 [Exophiala bonariae]
MLQQRILNLLAVLGVDVTSRLNTWDHLSVDTTQPLHDWKTGAGFGNASVRYREVPSHICELEPGVKSYSGYVDISEHEHIFFWFFEARNAEPENSPLTAWISGGPGDSAMAELFTEHGPCRVDPDEKTIHYNPFSWNNYSNMLYIDQPVQVGFSYSELVSAYMDGESEEIVELEDGAPCPEYAEICGNFSKPDPSATSNSTAAAAPNFWITLQAFMATFPQYSSHGFHFGSESYGGHYVPVFSQYILDQNDKNIAHARRIDLASILVGNGWFSPRLHLASDYDFAFNSGNPYDLENLDDSVRTKVHDNYYGKGNCLDQLKACEATGSDAVCQAADQFCLENVQDPFIVALERDINDVREMVPSPFPGDFYAEYLQRPEVRQAIGAYQTYIELNPTVGIAFDSTGDDARDLDIIHILGNLLDKGVRVTLYAGDADYECNWLGVEAVADAVGARGFDEAGYTNITTPDQVTHGQVKQSSGFSFVRVFEAGHATGAFQPFLLQTIFARTVAGTDLATGNRQANAYYQSQGPQRSTYREGNATVQDHVWPGTSTYNLTSNTPTLDNFQPSNFQVLKNAEYSYEDHYYHYVLLFFWVFLASDMAFNLSFLGNYTVVGGGAPGNASIFVVVPPSTHRKVVRDWMVIVCAVVTTVVTTGGAIRRTWNRWYGGKGAEVDKPPAA